MENFDLEQINIDEFTFYFDINNEDCFTKTNFQKFKEMDLNFRKKLITVIVDSKESVIYPDIFSYFPNLETLILPDSLEHKVEIMPKAFEKNKKLTKIVVNHFKNIVATEQSFEGVKGELKIVAGDINPKRVTKPKIIGIKLFLQLYASSVDKRDERNKKSDSSTKYYLESKSVIEEKNKCYKLLQKKFEVLSKADSLVSKRYWNKVQEKKTTKIISKVLRSSFVWAVSLSAIVCAILYLINFDFQANLVYVVGGFGVTLFLCILLKGILRRRNTANRYTKKVEKFDKKYSKNLEKLDKLFND